MKNTPATKIMNVTQENEETSTKYGGPHGLGDPNDKSLRKVESEILIPQKMRDKTREEKCLKEVEDFTNCCKDSTLLMIISCRKQNNALKACLHQWYNDEKFKSECKQEYLEERSEYRRTGVPQKSQKLKKLQSM